MVDINAASARQGDRKSVPDGSYATGQFLSGKKFLILYSLILLYSLTSSDTKAYSTMSEKEKAVFE